MLKFLPPTFTCSRIPIDGVMCGYDDKKGGQSGSIRVPASAYRCRSVFLHIHAAAAVDNLAGDVR